MIGEIWTYKAIKPNDNTIKTRPVLVIGDDSDNELQIIDINYVIVSSSAPCGKYDVELKGDIAKQIGLERDSVVKTTKIYTGAVSKLGSKIGDLPQIKKEEFIQKYREHQNNIINNL